MSSGSDSDTPPDGHAGDLPEVSLLWTRRRGKSTSDVHRQAARRGEKLGLDLV